MVDILQGIYGGILLFASFLRTIIEATFYVLRMIAESVNLVSLFSIYLPSFLVGACSIAFAIYIIRFLAGK